MNSQQQTSEPHLLLCFFIQCRYRKEEGQCGFSGTLIISLEGDCQCMERKRVEVMGSVTENVQRKF